MDYCLCPVCTLCILCSKYTNVSYENFKSRALKASITCRFMAKHLLRIRYGFVTDQISIGARTVKTIRYTSFDKSTVTDPISKPSIGSVEQSVTDEYLISYGFFFLVV